MPHRHRFNSARPQNRSSTQTPCTAPHLTCSRRQTQPTLPRQHKASTKPLHAHFATAKLTSLLPGVPPLFDENEAELLEISLASGSVLIRPWGPKRHPAAHSQFSPSDTRAATDPTKGRRAAGRRLGPHERPSTIPGACHISKSRAARSDRWLRP